MAGNKNLVLNVSAVTDQFSRAMKEANGDLAAMGRASAEMAREVNENMAKIGDDPANMSRNMAKNFTTAMRDAQRMAKTAMASGEGGALGGFSSEGALSAAENMDKLAAAARARAAAAEVVVAADEQQAAALRNVVIQSNAAAEALTHEAQTLRQQGTAMAAVESQMAAMGVVQNGVVEGHNRMSVSGMMLMHSIRSGTDSFAAGLPPMMIFSEQVSRLAEASAYAAAESGKTTGAMATFANVMGGPWGLAIVGGISVLSTMIGHMDLLKSKLAENAKALEDVKAGDDGLGEAQKTLGAMFDLATGKLKEQNEMLRLNARLTSAKLRAEGLSEQEAAGKTFGKAGSQWTGGLGFSSIAQGALANLLPGGLGGVGDEMAAAKKVRDLARGVQSGSISTEQAMRQSGAIDFKGLAISRTEFNQALIDRAQSGLKISTADKIDKTLDSGKLDPAFIKAEKAKNPRANHADHMAERDAEAEKKSDAAYQEEFAAARAKQAELARDGITDLQTIADLDKKAIDAARYKESLATEEKGRREKWSAIDIAALQIEQDLAAEDKKRAIDTKLARDLAAQDLTQQQNALRTADQILTVQGQLAPTLRERLAILRQLLENERQQAILSVRQDVNAGKITGDQGSAKIAETNALYAGKAQVLDRQNAGPMDAYRQRLKSAAGDMTTALQSVEADGLKGLEDGLTGLITGTENAATAFSKMAMSIIADLARIAVEKTILSAIGGIGGGFGGGLGADAGATIAANPAIFREGGLPGYRAGGIPGFAGGVRLSNGMISGPGSGTSDSILAMVNGQKPILVSNQEGIVNAQAVRNYWPIIDAMNRGTFPKFADGGLLTSASSVAYPAIPSARSVAAPGQTVRQYFSIDAKGAVLANDLMESMTRVSAEHASAALAAAPALTQQRMAARSAMQIPE